MTIPAFQVSTVVLVLDLLGTFVFALSGAMAGVKHRLDLFGVLVLSFVAANVGGITRDLLIGAVPPPGIADWRYSAVPVLAGLVTFYWGPVIDRLRSSVQIFDAGGLALFAASGALKALDFQLGPGLWHRGSCGGQGSVGFLCAREDQDQTPLPPPRTSNSGSGGPWQRSPAPRSVRRSVTPSA